jgi:drug/metabolite transporter (DMT)-like permease
MNPLAPVNKIRNADSLDTGVGDVQHVTSPAAAAFVVRSDVIAAGIGLAFAATIANAFALVLQASEARRVPVKGAVRFSLFSELIRRRRWVAGTSLLVLAWPLQVLALTYAPITVVQPILSTFQLILLVLARTTLGEHVGRREALGASAIVTGVIAVLLAAPRHAVLHPDAARVAAPLVVVGVAALLAYVAGQRHPTGAIALIIGAGLAYAWVDFANKLLSNALSLGNVLPAVLWLLAILGFGALSFLEESGALQRRPAVTVAPVIGSIQEPLPVVMALAAGVERWSSSPAKLAALVAGLGLVAGGAAVLGRSGAVARAAGQEPTEVTHADG